MVSDKRCKSKSKGNSLKGSERRKKQKMLFFKFLHKTVSKIKILNVMQVELQLVKRECIVCGEIKRNKCDWIPLAAEVEVVKGGSDDPGFHIHHHLPLSQSKMTLSDIN